MNAQRWLFGIFGTLLLVASVVWFTSSFEFKELEEHVGFRGEAKTNSLYAARLFLKRMGIPAERQDLLSTLPDTNTVVVLDTQRYTLSQQKVDALLAWVEHGGHLITRARVPTESTSLYDKSEDHDPAHLKPDYLQTKLGIRVGKEIIPDEEELPVPVTLHNMGYTLKADPLFFYELLADPKQKVFPQQYQKATWLLEQPWGNGMVTLAANLDFIENADIDNYDHAELFWHMVHALHKKPTSVWLLHQDDMPPLWNLLWRHAWALVITLALFLPLTLLALMPRFGPMQPLPAANRRRILEHIYASGIFMWQRHTKQHDTQYQTFAATVEQLTPSTRKQHDKP